MGSGVLILVTNALDIYFHSTVFQSVSGDQNIWAILDFEGVNEFGELFWKLGSYDKESAQSETFASVSSDLNIQINSAILKSETGDLNIWANLVFVGKRAQGDLIWKLVDYGIIP